MATIYVSKANGNDANDGLTDATAKATMFAAEAVSASGDTIEAIEPSESFFENIALGYFFIDKALTFRSRFRGDRACTIGGISGAFSVRIQSSGVEFEGMKVSTSASSTTLIFVSTEINDVTLDDVEFTLTRNNATLLSTQSITNNVTFRDCRVKHNGFDSRGVWARGDSWQFVDTDLLQTISSEFGVRALDGCNNLSFTRTRVEASLALSLNDQAAAASVTFQDYSESSSIGSRIGSNWSVFGRDMNCKSNGIGFLLVGSNTTYDLARVTADAANTPLGLPGDGDYSNVTGTASNIVATCYGASGHTFLIGSGGVNCRISELTATARASANFGFVMKGSGNVVTQSKITGGNSECVLFKGATDCVFVDNDVTQNMGGSTLEFRNSDTTPNINSTGNQVIGNRINVVDGSLYQHVAGQSSSNVVDGNTYNVLGAWGEIDGVAISSLAESRAAWTNDQHSVDLLQPLETLATNMRGTDGANTVAPDNDGILTILTAVNGVAGSLAGVFDTADVTAIRDAVILAIETQLDGSDVSVQAIGIAVRDAILDRLLAGNHDTAGSLGAVVQAIATGVTGIDQRTTEARLAKLDRDIAHAGDAATYQATVDAVNVDQQPTLDAIAAVDTKQDNILQAIARPTYSQSPVDFDCHELHLVRGDAYDGTAWPKLSWDVGKDIDTKEVTLTVRYQNDTSGNPILTATGAGEGNSAVVTLTSTQTASLSISENSYDYKFDVSINHSADSKQTIAAGNCIVAEDQTRD